MRRTRNMLLISLLATAAIYSCKKGSNDYSVTDHTTGMVKMRSWSGTASGYVKTDTVLLPDTAHVDWASLFNQSITDTSFSVEKINGFQVSVLAMPFNYVLTDTVNKIVRFDTTLSGSATSILTYYYGRDSMTYEFHHITGYSTHAAQYYQVNEFLHTN